MKMKTGKVVNFGRKRYGFIRNLESRKQYFVHVKDVAGRRDLQVGQPVQFEVGAATPGHRTKIWHLPKIQQMQYSQS